MISIPIHDQSGKPTGQNYEFDPSELVSGAKSRGDLNRQLLHDAVVMYEANRRQGTFKSKSRSEVAGSKKKMYKQKGTGRARMGAKRQGVRRGGGHIFAKRPTDYSYSMPRKALRLATRMALLSKFLDGEAVVVDRLSLDRPQTKTIHALLKRLEIVDRPRPAAPQVAEGQEAKIRRRPECQTCLIAIEDNDPMLWKSARNIPTVSVSPAIELNAYKLLKQKRLVITTAALDKLRGKESG